MDVEWMLVGGGGERPSWFLLSICADYQHVPSLSFRETEVAIIFFATGRRSSFYGHLDRGSGLFHYAFKKLSLFFKDITY